MHLRAVMRFCGIAVAASAVATTCAARAVERAPADRPLNVVVLVIDDTR